MNFSSKHRNACLALEARLEDFLDGRLDSREAADVESHTRSCARCAAALENARTGARLMGVYRAAQPTPSPFFVSRVMAAIRGERKQEEVWKPVETAAWRLCWIATALVLLLTVFMLRLQLAGPALPVQQNQVQALVNVPMPQPANDDSILLVASDDNAR
jgi:anti-sigma factor RsiW